MKMVYCKEKGQLKCSILVACFDICLCLTGCKHILSGLYLMLIVGFLGHKHLFQLQVEAFNTTSQPGGESVQWHEWHCLEEQKSIITGKLCTCVS